MRHLYCWHQPKQQSGSLVNNSDFLELSAKVEDLESRIGGQFTFENVVLNKGETLEEVITNPETNKIYIVQNGNEEDNDTYNEYVFCEEKGSFELIGSGSFAQFKVHVDNTSIHISDTDRTEWNNKQDKLTFDTKPTKDSTNPITSGGVWSYFPLAEQHLLEGGEFYPAYAFGLGYQSHLY